MFETGCSRSSPNGVFPLPSPQPERRGEDRIHVRILDDQGAAGEVGVDVELEVLREPAAQVRPQPADRERVGDRFVFVARREPSVGMNEGANLQAEISLVTLNEEPVAPAGGDRRRR